MTRLGPVPPRKVIRVLKRCGFVVVSQRGSHVKLRGPDGRLVVVPFHSGRDVKVGLLRGLLRDGGITPQRFLELL